jgi:predicted esterase
MLDIADRLRIDDCRWVAPAAAAGTWYPHRFMAPLDTNEPFLTQAIEACDRAVDEASDPGDARVVLVGFSQGGCLATEYAIRRSGRCAALVVFTGGLIGPAGTNWRLTPPATTLGGMPVMLTGSDVDEWVPEARVRETASVLTALGADVRCRIYPGRPHIISDAEITEARAFINLVI